MNIEITTAIKPSTEIVIRLSAEEAKALRRELNSSTSRLGQVQYDLWIFPRTSYSPMKFVLVLTQYDAPILDRLYSSDW